MMRRIHRLLLAGACALAVSAPAAHAAARARSAPDGTRAGPGAAVCLIPESSRAEAAAGEWLCERQQRARVGRKATPPIHRDGADRARGQPFFV
jgi:hypothetical protein